MEAMHMNGRCILKMLPMYSFLLCWVLQPNPLIMAFYSISIS